MKYRGKTTKAFINGAGMRVNISMTDDLENVVKSLENRKNDIEKNGREILERIVERGVEIAKAEVPVDTGELQESIHGEVEGNVGRIIAETNHSIFVEFGTGINGRMSEYPGDTLDYVYDYKNQNWVGNEANPFMYRTAEQLQTEIPSIVKEVIGDD